MRHDIIPIALRRFEHAELTWNERMVMVSSARHRMLACHGRQDRH